MELTQLAHNIDELRGFLTDMEGASLDPIKFRRYTIAFLSRAKRLSTLLRHDLSSYAKTQGLNYNELKRAHTWQRHARSNPITDFVYNIRNAFDHESLFLPRVMVTFMPLPNMAPMTGELNLATFTGTFEGLSLRAFSIDSSGREIEVPITFLQARYHFREWGFRNEHGDTVPEDQLLTSVPDVLTVCKVYMDCAEQFFKNLQESLSAEFGISKDFLGTSPMAASVPGPHGEFTQKATLTGFEKELTEAAAERAGEARNYFQAAEHDFGARLYRDAAENYQKIDRGASDTLGLPEPRCRAV